MQLFYHTEVRDQFHMDELESRHAVKVLRKKTGDEINVVNGKGSRFLCRIVDDNPKKCSLEILEEFKSPSKAFYTHIAIAPTKNMDRIEWFVEKAVEIGIDEISFLLCKHSDRKIIKDERVKKIAVSAMKQSLKTLLPKINALVDFKNFAENCTDELRVIAYIDETNKNNLLNLCRNNKSVCVAIGPEGDFSKEEVDFALKMGFKPASLGESRLRTETAGVVATHTINIAHS